MNIIEKIELDIKNARKASDAATLVSLQTLLGSIQNLQKNKQNDEGAISKIKSSLDGISVMLSHLDSNDSRVSKLETEKALLESYMPKVVMLNNDVVDDLISQNALTNIKDAMSFFQRNYAGKVDRAYVASKFLNKK